MDFSKRIYFICNSLKYRTLADIGTDHCHLPLLALKEKKIDRAIGIDINKGPLYQAKRNIVNEGFLDYIELRLGHGFSPIACGECEEAVIAGMGGFLISDILKAEPEKTLSFKSLILSPQSDVAIVRQTLHDIGLAIIDEAFIIDKNKFYNIIIAQPGIDVKYTKYEYIFGKKLLENPEEAFIEYLKTVERKNSKIINALTIVVREDMEKVQLLKEENQFLKGWVNID